MGNIFKTLLFCLGLTFSMVVTSCSDKEDEPDVPEYDGKIHIINNCTQPLDYLTLHTSTDYSPGTFHLYDLGEGEEFVTDVPEGFKHFYLSVRCPYRGHNHFSPHYKDQYYIVLTDDLLGSWKTQDDPIHSLLEDWSK